MSEDVSYCQPYKMFTKYGVELEYMIVARSDLTVQSIADRLIHAVTNDYVGEVNCGKITWSNELVLHVIELKTSDPADDLMSLPTLFQNEVNRINDLLINFDAQLLPTGMHPLMNPDVDAKLWPHDANAIYAAYNRIFDCRGHGWSNLQSSHLNLPFANDDEFAKLHTAIRLLLPIIPALSASTPIIDGECSEMIDNRLEVYRHNQRKIPEISGQVIPEAVLNQADYEKKILSKIFFS